MTITTTQDTRRAAAEAFGKKPAGQLFKSTPSKMLNGICVDCGGDATSFRDALSVKEWTIAGTCQSCQDEFYGGDYDDGMDGDHESGLASAGFGTDEDYGAF